MLYFCIFLLPFPYLHYTIEYHTLIVSLLFTSSPSYHNIITSRTSLSLLRTLSLLCNLTITSSFWCDKFFKFFTEKFLTSSPFILHSNMQYIRAGSKSSLRLLSFSTRLHQGKNVKKVDEHLQFLSKFYNPELLQSIKITESLVSSNDMLSLYKQGTHSKSRVPPSSSASDYSTTDAKWEEPILYPNQANNKSPYHDIPQIRNPDRTDLKLRFNLDKLKNKNSFVRKSQREVSNEIAAGLSKLTGLDERYIRNLYVRPIIMKRVSCQTGKGKIPNFYALTIVGNKDGMIGLGEGKSRDGMRTALMKAHWNAVKNLTPIPRYENRTIVGDFEYKFHAVKLFMRSAPAGFGLRVNPNVFEICQAAGIKDLGGKIYKSRNPMNVIKGFVEALTKQTSLEDLAASRGKKMVDLRKVYYSA